MQSSLLEIPDWPFVIVSAGTMIPKLQLPLPAGVGCPASILSQCTDRANTCLVLGVACRQLCHPFTPGLAAFILNCGRWVLGESQGLLGEESTTSSRSHLFQFITHVFFLKKNKYSIVSMLHKKTWDKICVLWGQHLPPTPEADTSRSLQLSRA